MTATSAGVNLTNAGDHFVERSRRNLRCLFRVPMKTTSLTRLILGLMFSLPLAAAFAQGTVFTYQGRLDEGGNPANGVFDLRFTAFDAFTGGNAVSGDVTNAATPVSDGQFTVSVDFGRPCLTVNRAGSKSVCGPTAAERSQRLRRASVVTVTPYAITAGNVVSGGIPSGTYGNACYVQQRRKQLQRQFCRSGDGLTNVSAATLGGFSSSYFWQLGGNTVAPVSLSGARTIRRWNSR